MYTFCLIGGGWRAEFFARVAKLVPDRFTLAGTWMRDSEKLAKWVDRFGGKALSSPVEAGSLKPDFIITSIPSLAAAEMLPELLDLNIPLLLETPLAWSLDALEKVKQIAKGKEHLINTAEQYLEWPYYRAWAEIIKQGLIGEVTCINCGALHGYHAVSIIRSFLDVGMEKCTLAGTRFVYPIVKTGDRSGVITTGEMTTYKRDTVSMQFESGKTALYDFSGDLYHSWIRSRHMVIYGTRGEISWDTVRYLTKDNLPVTAKIDIRAMGINRNNQLCLTALTLGERYLYRNPFGYARLNDDEIAVAMMMEKMGKVSRGELEYAYSFEDSVRDAEISCLMAKACENPHTVITG